MSISNISSSDLCKLDCARIDYSLASNGVDLARNGLSTNVSLHAYRTKLIDCTEKQIRFLKLYDLLTNHE